MATPDQEVSQLRAQLAAQSQLIEQLQRDMQELNTKYVAEIERAADTLHQKDVIEKELEELSCHLFEQANAMVAQERREKWELEHQLLMLRDRFHPIVHDRHINAFQSFLHHQQQLPLKRLGQCEFLKTCIEQDIEPCLIGKFGNRWSKRLTEHLLWQPCYIEKATAPLQYNQSHSMSRSSSSPGNTLWDRFLPSSSSSSMHNHTNNNARCAACGQTSDPLLYRFRLESEQAWLYIDQHCRDRLVAVSEFYSFIRKVHLGLFSRRSIHDLYHENVRLRLQMFYARYYIHPLLTPLFPLESQANIIII